MSPTGRPALPRDGRSRTSSEPNTLKNTHFRTEDRYTLCLEVLWAARYRPVVAYSCLRALGRSWQKSGKLVRPFPVAAELDNAYWLVTRHGIGLAARIFIAWLKQKAGASPP
jgi:hypothetical protein